MVGNLRNSITAESRRIHLKTCRSNYLSLLIAVTFSTLRKQIQWLPLNRRKRHQVAGTFLKNMGNPEK